MSWTVLETPVDQLLLTSDGVSLTGIEFEPHRPPTGEREDEDPVLTAAVAQLAEYFAGQRRDFDLPLAPRGTAFQVKVWRALTTIPYGQTTSYGEVARRIGMNPATTARAVGTANGSNPIPVVIPCHRVVGKDGSLTGFGGGLPRKRVLLDLESARLF